MALSPLKHHHPHLHPHYPSTMPFSVNDLLHPVLTANNISTNQATATNSTNISMNQNNNNNNNNNNNSTTNNFSNNLEAENGSNLKRLINNPNPITNLANYKVANPSLQSYPSQIPYGYQQFQSASCTPSPSQQHSPTISYNGSTYSFNNSTPSSLMNAAAAAAYLNNNYMNSFNSVVNSLSSEPTSMSSSTNNQLSPSNLSTSPTPQFTNPYQLTNANAFGSTNLTSSSVNDQNRGFYSTSSSLTPNQLGTYGNQSCSNWYSSQADTHFASMSFLLSKGFFLYCFTLIPIAEIC
jgi:hypothetical protein